MSDRIPLRAAETQRRILDSFALDLHTALPGVVRSYDANAQTAEVEIGIRRVLPAESEEDEPDTSEAHPILPSVPVAWPRAGGFFLHWPLAAGDSVLLVFSELDLNEWRASGGVVDPGLGLRHGLAGAVAIPGLYPRPNPCADASGEHGRVGREGGPFVEFRPEEIHVGGAAQLVKASELAAHLKAIEADLIDIAAAAGVPPPVYQHDAMRGLVADYRTTKTKGA